MSKIFKLRRRLTSKLTDYFYPSGELHVRCVVDCSGYNGPYTEYYENRRPKVITTYVNNALNGPYTFMDEVGRIKRIYNYVNGALEGPQFDFYESGGYTHSNYKGGRLSGCAMFYNQCGTLIERRPYENGLLHGTREWFREDGSRLSCCRYNRGKENGNFVVWGKRGDIKMLCKFRNGAKHGICRQILKGDGVVKVFNYVNGVLEGDSYEMFHGTSNFKAKYSYKNGKLHGMCVVWRENGIVDFTIEFADGKKHGEYVKKDAQGRDDVMIRFVDDAVSGHIVKFCHNGVFRLVEYRSDGLLGHGTMGLVATGV